MHARKLLLEVGGFEYDADACSGDLPYFVQVKAQRQLVPYTFTYDDARIVTGTDYGSPIDFLDNLRRGFDQFRSEGVTHPRVHVRPVRSAVFGNDQRILAMDDSLKRLVGARIRQDQRRYEDIRIENDSHVCRYRSRSCSVRFPRSFALRQQ